MTATTMTARRAVRRAAAALLCVAAALAPAAATAAGDGYCKVSDRRYIHAGQLGPDWWVYWWCADGTLQVSGWLHDQLTSEQVAASMAYTLGLNPGWPTSEAAPPWSDPRMRALSDAARLMAAADRDRPPRPKWLVAKNGSAPTRPSYPFADGVRGKTSDGRAPVGAPCDCARAQAVEGSTTYCAFDALAAGGSGSGAGLGPAAPPITPPAPVSVAVCRQEAAQ